MYHLSTKALAKIESLRPGIIRKLATALDCSDGSINRYIRENDVTDDLTKYGSLEVLRKETGLSDAQLLINDAHLQVKTNSSCLLRQ